MRGKLLISAGTTGTGGITPAHAGKTIQPPLLSHIFWDHPRACGENFVPSLAHCGKVGSPPRMRGKPSDYPAKVAVQGITPAHAGKTD